MKFVRTKNGKIVSLINNDYDINVRGDIVLENNEYVPYEDILEIANTIEELCDRYIIQKRVYGKKSYEKFITYKIKKDRFYPRRTRQEIILEINDYDTIYGAIWTDKGLIYVAKMNDKGELELL